MFEGPDGSGKSTQYARTLQFLNEFGFKKGKDIVEVREPGGTRIGEQVRRILLDPDNADLTPRAELLLFNASRAQLVKTVIEPAVNEGKIVVSDRSYIASIAYQIIGGGEPIDEGEKVILFAIHNFMPDHVYLLDVMPEIGLLRRGVGKDRIEQKSLEYHHSLRNGYLLYARANTDLIKVIDGTPPVEDVWLQVKSDFENRVLKEWLNRSGRKLKRRKKK